VRPRPHRFRFPFPGAPAHRVKIVSISISNLSRSLARTNDRSVDTRGNAARDEKTDRFRESSSFHSEMTPEGKRVTKLDQILLNGNNIALLVPGGMPDEEE
jgi:hypothetical protein